MNGFTYEALPTRVVFGWGALDQVGPELDRFEAKRVLLIASGSAKPFADEIAQSLGERVVARIDGVPPHVPVEAADEARSQTRLAGVDAVVSIGGGSTIGLGKSIALVAPVRHLAVPTTYSGSEMTPFYGVTEAGIKQTGRSVAVKPEAVVYDPATTVGIPRRVGAGSAMNAMAHCVEALYAKESNPITTLIALEGMRTLDQGLALVDGDAETARSLLLYGSSLGGLALASVGMAIHHRICHVLGGSFGLAHGDANAVILPQALAANAAFAPEAAAAAAAALGSEDPAGHLFDLAARAGAPSSLAELGVEAGDLGRAVDLITSSPSYNPRPVEPGWIRELLTDALEGKRPTANGERGRSHGE
jgi:maleylacetate reductase